MTTARNTAAASDLGTDPMPLAGERLAELGDFVVVPAYDRSKLVPAVVHIGVGGFHRAHQALYFDEIAHRGISTEWGVVGVGLHSPAVGEVLVEQDNLYSVVVRDSEADDVRVVGVLTDYLFAPNDPAAVLQVLADPRTRLVTLTITGTAYPSGGAVDPADPDVQVDVTTPESPATAFGYLVEGLDRRRRAGLPGFTVLSCDNNTGNGAATRGAVLSTAALRDSDLADWIDEHVTFPSSMVDRITPETTDELRAELAAEHGLADQWPVATEPFSQWIVEDNFCAGRPPLDQVGVKFVSDVLPYELMKARLLNAGHCALAYVGSLAAFETADEAMADPAIQAFVAGYLREASSLLLAVPGIDLDDYCQTLLERFANPRISDRLTRLARRGSTKIPSYVLPSIQQALDQNRSRTHLVMTVATWFRYLRGVDHAGVGISVQDNRAEELQSLAVAGGTDPHPLLSAPDLFGVLADNPRFLAELAAALQALEQGPLEALRLLEVSAAESAA